MYLDRVCLYSLVMVFLFCFALLHFFCFHFLSLSISVVLMFYYETFYLINRNDESLVPLKKVRELSQEVYYSPRKLILLDLT